MKKTVAAGALALAMSPLSAFASDCGQVSIADMNWSSASLIANVDRFILEHGFGCDAELVPGDTMPTGTSMIEKGEPDIAPEMWSNGLKEAIDKGVSEGRLNIAGNTLADGGEEGFWVPAYMVEKDPSLATIEGIRKNAALFEHPEDPDLSAFYGCPAGWNCQISGGNNFRALKLDEAGFDLIDPGSGAGLSGSIAKAYEREEAWFGYYWAPTAVLGKYKMVKVDFGTGVDKELYLTCTSQADCDATKATMWPASAVVTLTTTDFAQRAPEAYTYLSTRNFKNDDMNVILAWMEENQADGEIAMEHFFTSYPALWKTWLPADVTAKVQSALDAL
ncbi:MAG: ABC transporter substrate-binding protein [Pontibacterium sp.]